MAEESNTLDTVLTDIADGLERRTLAAVRLDGAAAGAAHAADAGRRRAVGGDRAACCRCSTMSMAIDAI